MDFRWTCAAVEAKNLISEIILAFRNVVVVVDNNNTNKNNNKIIIIIITGSALALHCCKAHEKINRKIENPPPVKFPCKIVTHEDFNLKLGTRDYVVDITHHATFGSNRASGGFPTNRRNITQILWLFCCRDLFLDTVPWSNRWTDSYAEWLRRRVSAQLGRSFWGSGRWVTSYGKHMPQKLPEKERE